MRKEDFIRVTLGKEDLSEQAKKKTYDLLELDDFKVDKGELLRASFIVFEDGKGYRRELKVRDVWAAEDANPHCMRDLRFFTGAEGLVYIPGDRVHVICTAVQLDDYSILSAPRPARHHHLLAAWHFKTGGQLSSEECTQGFMLSDGTFADREKAAIVAMEAGQVSEFRHGDGKPYLYSEDIW